MADLLSQDERDLMASDFADIVDDCTLQHLITYRELTGSGTFNPSTGKKEPTFNDFEVPTFRQPIATDEFAVEGYELGDARYLIRKADFLPTVFPKTEDRMIDGTETRFIVEVREDPLGIFYSIVSRHFGEI